MFPEQVTSSPSGPEIGSLNRHRHQLIGHNSVTQEWWIHHGRNGQTTDRGSSWSVTTSSSHKSIGNATMVRSPSHVKATFNWCVIGGIAAVLSMFSLSASGEEPTIWKIEEDWEMVIYEPDPSIYSPQVTFFTSPSLDLDDTYFQLQMNYEADEAFSAGGFHVAAVSNGSIVDEERSSHRITLGTSNDQIRWTSVMAVVENKLLFAVKDGHGTEWGDFGGPEYLVRVVPSPVQDLSNYHHQQSLDSVDIGFGANRVQSVTLRHVRIFYSNGVVTDLDLNLQP